MFELLDDSTISSLLKKNLPIGFTTKIIVTHLMSAMKAREGVIFTLYGCIVIFYYSFILKIPCSISFSGPLKMLLLFKSKVIDDNTMVKSTLLCLIVLSLLTLSESYYIYTFAGHVISGYSGNGGPATSATLKSPFGVAVSPIGEVYISNTDNNRIRVVFTNGTITTYADNGIPGYSGDGGLATNAQLYFPNGVAVSPNNEIYIADTRNN